MRRPLQSRAVSYKTLLVEEVGDVLSVTLNRPEVHNAFNDELIAEGHRFVRRIGARRARWCGAAERCICAMSVACTPSFLQARGASRIAGYALRRILTVRRVAG